jgi:hypothetical protein
MALSRRRNNTLKIVALAAIVALTVCVCGAQGAGRLLAGDPRPSIGGPNAAGWVALGEPARVTFYGAHYPAGDVTASGIRYAPDADIVALGPARLAAVREYYRAAAVTLGMPLYAEWMPGPHLSFRAIAGGFPRHSCFSCEPEWWGYVVRVCDRGDGRPQTAGESCQVLRVADTGREGLDVDLPDATWLRFGYPAAQGVFTGTLQVAEVGR